MNLEQIITENAARRKLRDGSSDGWIADLIGAPYLGYESTLRNAAFIAAARNDNAPEVIDALVAEVRRLETLLAARPER